MPSQATQTSRGIAPLTTRAATNVKVDFPPTPAVLSKSPLSSSLLDSGTSFFRHHNSTTNKQGFVFRKKPPPPAAPTGGTFGHLLRTPQDFRDFSTSSLLLH